MSKIITILSSIRGNFVRQLIAIAIPIAVQNILFSSRGLVDVIMLGQLGEAEIAAVGVAARATFVSTIMLVGVTTGGALLTAQYWGAANKQGVRESTALTCLVSMFFATITVLMFMFFSESVMSLATDSPDVIRLGSEYLQITSVSMYAVAMVSSMAVGLRAMHKPGISTFFSAIGIGSNVVLNWVLIFGHFGLPAMGIAGAAIATVLSGVIEIVTLYGYLYRKQHLLAFGWHDVVAAVNLRKVKRFLQLSLPTTFNFLIWSGGLFVYHAIMGLSGVQGLAALSVMTPVESISLSFMIGISSAAAVLVGNQLGAKEYEKTYDQAIALTILCVFASIVVAILLYLLQTPVLNAFSALTPETRALAEKFIAILSIGIVLRSFPMSAIVGVLRAGGDVKFCLYQDICAQWVIGIPVTAIVAVMFHAPPEWVYLAFLTEECVKWIGSIPRIRSKKWMRNLIDTDV
ncbi:Na+ driven multidrug efflux pump [Vibrio sp. MEBiC08052]|nr:MATE family efflux transporter [Vibrio sp. MEBiC08052]KUI99383.1 Na+ driven multidrug efflux pump [Vibrio sp. MEBiC08052]